MLFLISTVLYIFGKTKRETWTQGGGSVRMPGAGNGGGNSSSILAIYEVGSCVGKLDINSHYTSPTHFLPTAPLQASLLATIHPLPVREHTFIYITVRKKYSTNLSVRSWFPKIRYYYSIFAIAEAGLWTSDKDSHYTSLSHFLLTAPLLASLNATIHQLTVCVKTL